MAGQALASGHLREIAPDLEVSELSDGGEAQVVARLDAASAIKRGDDAELWLNARRVTLFDPDTGANLSRSAPSG